MTHLARVEADSEFSEYSSDVERTVLAVLHEEQSESGAITVVLTDSEHMQMLNRDFTGKDEPTDVLSFTDGTVDPDLDLEYLGDIIIAVPIAEEQAARGAHSVMEELMLLTVHGTLHLLGYDHTQTQDKDHMWTRQDQILGKLGVTIRSPE